MMVRRSCLVVVPMKDPSMSKTRLRSALSPQARRTLACSLYRRTLDVLIRAQKETPFDIAVVTGSADAARIAEDAGVMVIDEGAQDSLTDAVTYAGVCSGDQGYDAMVVLPADLAAPSEDDIVRFIEKGQSGHDVVICPATDLGTNALYVSPPNALTFAYGVHSARTHLLNAMDAGLDAVLMPLDSLKFDIDTSACLARAMRDCPDFPAPMELRA